MSTNGPQTEEEKPQPMDISEDVVEEKPDPRLANYQPPTFMYVQGEKVEPSLEYLKNAQETYLRLHDAAQDYKGYGKEDSGQRSLQSGQFTEFTEGQLLEGWEQPKMMPGKLYGERPADEQYILKHKEQYKTERREELAWQKVQQLLKQERANELSYDDGGEKGVPANPNAGQSTFQRESLAPLYGYQASAFNAAKEDYKAQHDGSAKGFVPPESFSTFKGRYELDNARMQQQRAEQERLLQVRQMRQAQRGLREALYEMGDQPILDHTKPRYK